MDKLHIRNEMRQLDTKNRDFYDELTDEERKRFSNYLMIRWSSSVSGSPDMQGYYLQSCNHKLNRHFFAVNRHPKLQWLLATTVSPDMGALDHHYLRLQGRDKGASEVKKFLTRLYPTMKMQDIEVLAGITDPKEIKQHLKDSGE